MACGEFVQGKALRLVELFLESIELDQSKRMGSDIHHLPLCVQFVRMVHMMNTGLKEEGNRAIVQNTVYIFSELLYKGVSTG